MARKAKDGGVNKSEAIRELLKEQPAIKGKDAVAALGEKGIKISTGLFFLVKGKIAGGMPRGRKTQNAVGGAMVASGNSNALATILKVKKLAEEVGGMKVLESLIEALSE